MSPPRPPGATLLPGGRCAFHLWAPASRRVHVRLRDGAGERLQALAPAARGWHEAVVDGVGPGCRYTFLLDGDLERTDPASHHQPGGVHEPSAVVDPEFPWTDAGWRGLELARCVFYELHVGTFTQEGTFDAVIPRLEALRALGITALQLMPVAQFPGERNWGYDGVYPYAVQDSYGGPAGLRRLVDACHQRDLAVALDVVYNHLGPEGNYLGSFGPFFTPRYGTPWGQAINFDGPDSDGVRDFFIANALYWVRDFHIDALRLDAIHGIFDFSANHILRELQDAVQDHARQAGRRILVIAESDLNDSRVIRPHGEGGHGLDAQWSDDFHHALHTLLTGEQAGYYADFGDMTHFVEALRQGYVYTGQYSGFRRRRHGNDTTGLGAAKFVVCTQNHDQVGNRLHGDRLAAQLSLEAQKLAAGLLLLAPQTPLLFMGQEYGETAPFCYFTSHGDPDLVEAVRRGRAEEFAAFAWQGQPPDPQDAATFQRSRLEWSQREQEPHRTLLAWHATLLQLRQQLTASAGDASAPAFAVESLEAERLLCLRRWNGELEIAVVARLRDTAARLAVPLPAGSWSVRLDSAASRWLGPGSHTPARLTSTGSTELDLAPWTLLVLQRD